MWRVTVAPQVQVLTSNVLFRHELTFSNKYCSILLIGTTGDPEETHTHMETSIFIFFYKGDKVSLIF